MTDWNGRRVLITGVVGTVGQELLDQVLRYEPEEVIGIDNNESGVFFLSERHRHDGRVRLALGDIRDREKLMRKTQGVDVVLHAAALKHVTACEQEPTDAVQTNVLGTQNVIDAAHQNGVGRVLYTSTDKAVNPTNVMGTSKLMAERLVTAAHAHSREGTSVLASTRFGNVLGSRGSVIPLFAQQIKAGGPVTLTHQEMTRFIMTLEQAVRLVLDSVWLAQGGEVFVTKMPAIRIQDLAEVLVEELAPVHGRDPSDVEVAVVGPKPGEKLYEELMNGEEARRTVELKDHFSILPAFRNLYRDIRYDYGVEAEAGIEAPYNSQNADWMGKRELTAYLRDARLLEDALQVKEEQA